MTNLEATYVEHHMSLDETAMLLSPVETPLGTLIKEIEERELAGAGSSILGMDIDESAERLFAKLVQQFVANVPVPCDPGERERYLHVIADLAQGDGNSAAARLERPHDCFGGAYALISCYAAALLVIDGLHAVAIVLPGRDNLLRCIRHQARVELSRLPAHGTVEWIVPATPADRTAAHVASLIFARLGIMSRPWLRTMVPDHGRFTIIGATSRKHLEAHHHRCEGCMTFTDVSDRIAHLS